MKLELCLFSALGKAGQSYLELVGLIRPANCRRNVTQPAKIKVKCDVAIMDLVCEGIGDKRMNPVRGVFRGELPQELPHELALEKEQRWPSGREEYLVSTFPQGVLQDEVYMEKTVHHYMAHSAVGSPHCITLAHVCHTIAELVRDQPQDSREN